MLRLREDPLVDPHQDRRGSVASLKLWVRRHERPVVLFPEGHRSRTGEVAPFQASGMRVILGERRVPVYLLVSDGFWACRRLSDFVFNMGSIDGRTEVLGPFEPPDSPGGLLDFVERMRGTLVAHLEAMRRADH